MELQSNAEYEDRTFSLTSAPHPTITGSDFLNCRFEGGSLAGTALDHCSFIECTFTRSDLSLLSVLGCRLRDVRFQDCKLMGIDWTQAGERGAKLKLDIGFHRCVLDHCSFKGINMQNIDMVDCSAREVDLADVVLTGAHLNGTDFLDAVFLHTDLRKADLRGARNYRIDPRDNRLAGARVALPEAISLLRGLDVIVDE